ncbi:winged helix-turn-helix domain-containing protein [Methanonatronarchaeum sp. AMET6-2]|uniref:winged helix-turn-helix domain-containing protein n=1 Tax=Methanonatronarchaeum sp. AMET6-2 TaxID=2933293 RepID=UPI001FF3C1EA|nr:winged helix-turn-helix domain-containing protein [Methanonatronarchaeum sp. AMET6-2]UOY09900.1 winged helix-turn-helix domain-containing protein [Methanonatronarchaeum sp. AMET6-2]
MCEERKNNIGCCEEPPTENIKKLRKIAKALHCKKRWEIIGIIGTGTATTSQIKNQLQKQQEITQSSLYYHLSQLKKSGIIEVQNYKEKGQGAPEKNWKLTTQKIEIDLLKQNKKNKEKTK